MQRVHLIIRGLVQGVFYRVTTRQQAQLKGIAGWVKNLPDGSVECVAQGPEKELQEFILWHRSSPGGARVDEVEAVWEETDDGLATFEITY